MQHAVQRTAGLRESRKAARRNAIVEAARASFLERGYLSTSMSGLIDTIGGSKATLWSYFRSKEELFAAVIDEIAAEFRDGVTADLDQSRGLTDDLTAFCTRFVDVMTSPEGLATWRMLASEASRAPEVREIFFRRAVQPVQDVLGHILNDGIDNGHLVPRPITEMQSVLLGMCAGRQQSMLWESQEDGAAMAPIFVEVFLRAYGVGSVGELSLEATTAAELNERSSP